MIDFSRLRFRFASFFSLFLGRPKVVEDLVEENVRRKQRIRSLVREHDQVYHVGPGRRGSVRRKLSPYWRGPEG